MTKRPEVAVIDPDEVGFVRVASDDLALHYHNVSMLRNEVSPFCLTKSRFRFDCTGVVVDPHYGQVYEAGVELPRCFYGRTEELPPYAGERPGQLGFLRVPFRRIPRLPMRNRREFDRFISQIQSADASLLVLFRGQNREHLLDRGAAARELLYGDPDAREPSMLPSATRHGVQLEDIGPEWSMTVQFFIWAWVGKLRLDGTSQRSSQEISAQMDWLVAGYNLWAFLISVAQHYGLPSVGLDVTDRPDVALFFALTRIEPQEPGSHVMRTSRVPADGDHPVIYIFSPQKDDVMEFARYRPRGFPVGRPDRQNAFFLHTSWGHARNSIASRMWVALDLDPAGDWGPLPLAQELFPGPLDDPFAAFLDQARDRPGSEMFHRFLSRFYVVA
jgi:hypothetical protein